MSSETAAGTLETTDSLDGRAGLSSRSFVCLVIAQALGTLNDNMFRWLAVPIGTHMLGGTERAEIAALSWGIFWFTLPYLLLPTHAGWLADRFSKRSVIVWCKAAEVVVMLLGVGAILSGSAACLFASLFLMGTQAALFAPSKFGSIPEMLRTDKLSAGNGLMAMVTVMTAAAGTVVGFKLFIAIQPDGTHNIWIPAVVVTVIAVAGWLVSLGIRQLPAARPDYPIPKDPLSQNWKQLKLLASNRTLMRTALGIAFFFTLATLTQANIKLYGESVLGLTEKDIGPLMLALVFGVGLGSVLAGIWSGGRVELGIVPLGAIGVVIMSLALFATGNEVDPERTFASQRAYYVTIVCLILLGASAGLFDVPLESFLQHRSPPETRGSLLAATNFVTFSGILSTSGILYVMQHLLELTPRQTFLAIGLGTIPIALYILFLLPQATIRFVLWLISHTAYRVRIYGRENLPETGGALLVANHVTWLDAAFILISSSRPVRMLAYADYVRGWGVERLTKIMGVIPVNPNEGPKSIVRSLETARQCIRDGELVCIFAEGHLTRTGQLQPFQRGLMKIVEGTGAPVIPVYLDGLWGSIFSFFRGKYFWKLPLRWPYPVGILFGPPLRDPDNVYEVRQAVQNLGVEATEYKKEREMNLPRMFLRNCRKSMSRSKIADSAGQNLSGGQLLLRTLIVKRLLERNVLAADEKFVGLLLPPSVGGVLANAALPLMGRVPVNLNYTASSATINHCIQEAGIKHVLTSRLFVTKMRLQIDSQLVYLEDFKDMPTKLDKLVAGIQAYAVPIAILERMFGLTKIHADDLLTIIFTSGSTGEPKGVMLTYHNIRSNVDAIEQMFQLKATDVLLGVLPLFHSFGFTGTMWSVLALEPKGVYHFNPLDARVIGTLCAEHKTTIMMATPTFLRGYLKRCEKEQLQTVDLVVMGAEKMPVDLAQAFFDKFGVRPIEGYGTTELSPVAAVNVPDHRSSSSTQKGTKEGSVGRPLPGSTAKIVDPDTFEELGVDQPGLLLIKGPNVMRGYLNKPELTASVIRDGWYITGDIAKIDAEGFIIITDRASRFSKIGGEMVPHIKVEEFLQKIAASEGEEEHELKVVVTSVPDEKKGERLIVVHRPLSKTVEQMLAELNNSGLPNLWIPSRDSFLEVAEIPHLGTGKVDLKGLKTLALEKFGAKAPGS
jgi:acyl-[acyl-carrier-protein]-phospholipid O-acyltransferase/long-chain-fatty-acid--[acyl-carrier-protein] ligase